MKVHDHLSGSANCVECKGRCQLQADELALTQLVRFVLEFFAYSHKGWMPLSIEDALWDLLGEERFKNLRMRAIQECAKVPR